MKSQYFEPLFRIYLSRQKQACEQSAARILEEKETLSEADRKLLLVFAKIQGYTMPTRELLEEMNNLKVSFRDSGLWEGAFLLAFLIAHHQTAMGFFAQANEYFEECLTYGSSLDEKYLSLVFSGLAKNYFQMSDSVSTVPDSLPEYGRIAIEKAGDDPLLLADAYISHGYELWSMNLWDELLVNAQKIDALLEREGLPDLRMFVSEEYVQAYIGMKNFPKALECAKAMYDYELASGNEYNIAVFCANLGDVYALNGQYTQALTNMKMAMETGRKLEALSLTVSCNEALIRYSLLAAGLGDLKGTLDEMKNGMDAVYKQKYQTEFNEKTSAIQMDFLKKEREHEKQAGRMKSDFLANMSHEIRTPMNAISGMAELILRCDRLEQAKEYAANVKNASRSLLTIINDILDFSKIEAGKLDIVPSTYQLTSVLNDIAGMAAVWIGDKPLEFAVEADGQLPFELYGDEIRIRQVLLNFISNAVKFTRKGKVTLRIDGRMENEDAIMLRASVSDTGAGIRQEDLPKLFTSFSQVDTRKNRAKEGTGLGLAICKRLTELMGGEVTVESTYGEGSTFTATFPQKIISAKPMGGFVQFKNSQGMEAFAPGFIAPKAKVLVVDDNEVNLAVAKGLLAPYQMEVSAVTSAADCLALLKKERFDLVFMDHMMPVMDGMEATKMIRRTDAVTPVVALTANAVSGARETYLQNGFSSYLTKPIEVRELNAVLEEFLPKALITKVENSAPARQEVTDDIYRIIYLEGQHKLPKLRQLFEESDVRNYVIEVHALKSVALTAGQTELGELAKLHEEAGRAGDWEAITAGFERLTKLYGAWLDSLAHLAQGQSDTTAVKAAMPQAEIDKLFSSIRESAGNYDIDGVNEAIVKLKGVLLGGEELRRLEKIETFAQLIDYGNLAAI